MNRLMWPGCVFILVGALVAVDVTMIIVANNRPSFAVHPHYNDADSSWDQQREQQEANTRLGWSTVVDRADIDGTFEIIVSNRIGDMITDADVTLRVFHRARARRILRVDLLATEPGRYVGRLPLERAGHWECEVTVNRGDDRFVQLHDLFIPGEATESGEL